MREIIELKRKQFEVIEELGEHSKKVERNGKIYFLKEYPNKQSFELALDNFNKLHKNGVFVPDIYMYEKNKFVMVREFIEGETVLDMLLKEDLSEEIIEKVFNVNWYVRNGKLSIDFKPENFKLYKDKLCYLPLICGKYNEKYLFQNQDIWFWFYTKDFVNYIINKGIKVDQNRANVNQAALNKNIALMVVKYYK